MTQLQHKIYYSYVVSTTSVSFPKAMSSVSVGRLRLRIAAPAVRVTGPYGRRPVRVPVVVVTTACVVVATAPGRLPIVRSTRGLFLVRSRRGAPAAVVVALTPAPRVGVTLADGVRGRKCRPATAALLCEQHAADPFVDWLELSEVGRGDLDGVPGHWEDYNVLPRVQLVLVLDHLGALPVVLDASALQGELLHLHRNRTPGLRLDDRNVVLRL